MDQAPPSSLQALDTGPRHVAIIMDGNGRWAAARGLPRAMGHKAGAEAVRRTLDAAIKIGIPYITLYGFSSENWRRPETEITDLMQLLRFYLKGEIAAFHKAGIRLLVIGEREKLAPDIVAMIERAEDMTAANSKLTLTIALSYGGRQEILAASRAIAADIQAGRILPQDITETLFAARLFTHQTPDPDLLVRTSGEQRISNFLLWQSAYAEFFFTETLWPDFSEQDLQSAVTAFKSRDRRYGGRPQQTSGG
jgi:undecaprenyl diphosphate synthase